MSNIQLEPEFVRLVQGIYGDANLDGKTIKQLYQTWKTNPQFLSTAYRQKNPSQISTDGLYGNQEAIAEQRNIQSQRALDILHSQNNKYGFKYNRNPTTLIHQNVYYEPKQYGNISQPINNGEEIAWDDLSGISSFNDAFRIARQRNLQQFRWKSTKANPSGLFQVELATQKPKAPESPKNTKSSTSTEQSATPRGTMSKTYWKSMIDKGFTWDSKKGMWINPKKESTTTQTQTSTTQPTAVVQQPAPAPTSREWRWTDGLFGKGVKWSWNPMDGVSLSTSLFQQGGKLEDSQKAFVAYLIQVSGAQSEQELNDFIQSLGEEGLKQQYQQFVQTMQNGTQSARNGAKLNYIKSLRGLCPDGYELGYFKEGGQICAKCVEKREKMGGIPFRPLQGEKGTKVVQDFKKDLKNKKDKITIDSKKKTEKKELGGVLNISPELLDMFKCGGKAKKTKKKEDGGLMKKKSGIPIKEKFIDKDKCGKKMKKKK